MRYLHTMLRVRNLDAALDFYCNKLGLKETRRRVDEKNKYTLVFLAGPEDVPLVKESKKNGRPGPEVELTYNWDSAKSTNGAHTISVDVIDGETQAKIKSISAERVREELMKLFRPPHASRGLAALRKSLEVAP